jgi:microcystin-dependent protein
MSVFQWSQSPSANATADPGINWAEGMAPSQINDSARAEMAQIAKYRDDIAGAIVTAGTATAYTVGTFSQFDSLAHLNGQIVAFTPHVTNGAGPVMLNVDSLGQKPLRSAPNVDLLAGVIIQGTPYVALYNNADGAFYLQGFYDNPFGIPLGASMQFWGTTAPNSNFAFPFGQAISRTTYATLFTLLSTTYGAGDGLTTFNLPDLRGRVVASPDNMGGSDAGRLSNAASNIAGQRNSLGGTGGEVVHTLSLGELPTGITSNGVNNISVGSSAAFIQGQPTVIGQPGTGSPTGYLAGPSQAGVSSSGNNNIGVTSNNTGGGAHNVVQPTILANQILRIL